MGKSYKAIVIDGKSIFRRVLAALIVVIMLFLIFLVIFLSDKDTSKDAERFAISAVSEYIPFIGKSENYNENDNIFLKAVKFIAGFDISDLSSMYASEIPIIQVTNRGYLAVLASSETGTQYAENINSNNNQAEQENVIIPENMKPIKLMDLSQMATLANSESKILLKNETSYSINIDEMLKSPLELDMKQSPLVLIVHTHATESFAMDEGMYYNPNESDRRTDTSLNIVSVGAEMARVLKENGIGVIHDQTLHDYPSYNGSYANSLATVEKYKQQYPSIQIVLDVHRDAIVYDDETKVKAARNINGKSAAQMMLVVGTNDGGLEHPRWRENLKFAMQLQEHIESKYSGLMRGVNLRKERFNGHTSLASIIVEVGTSGNTLAEAKYSGELFSKALAEFVK